MSMSLLNSLIIGLCFLSLVVYVVIRFILNEQQSYRLKYAFYVCIVMLAATVFQPLLLLRPRNAWNIRLLAIMLNPFLRLLGVRYRIVNGDILDKNQSYIFVANHQSSIDFIGMMHIWPEYIRYCTILAKKELIWSGPFGISSWLAGVEFIDRKSQQHSRQTMHDVVDKIRTKSLRLWVFPEGTRSMNEIFLPFKMGAFRSAIEAQVPIVPIVFSCYKPIYQADKVNNAFYWRPGCVTIQFLDPIDTKNMTIELNLHRLAEHTRQCMLDAYSKLQTTIDHSDKQD